ncbi:MAG: hypothetical protein PVF20_09265 [Desulfobacterales bacterium]
MTLIRSLPFLAIAHTLRAMISHDGTAKDLPFVGANGHGSHARFRNRVWAWIQRWDAGPIPSREDYLKAAAALARDSGPGGIWEFPPLMVTATIDDGLGHGLDVIEGLARGVGARVHRLGLMKTADWIIDACIQRQPDLLGLTVLQFDSDTDVARVSMAIPQRTTLVAGGASYRYDPGFAERTGTPVVAQNGVEFLKFLLAYTPQRP